MAEKNPVIVDPKSWAKLHLPKKDYDALLGSLDQPLDISIRINTLKAEPALAVEKWSRFYGWQAEPVPFCPAGFWIRKYDTSPSATLEHRLGYFYIQEAASMLPPELFDFSEMDHPLVLDMAASPGGKTTHLTALTNDRGLVIANDSSRSRLTALRIVLGSWGAANQAVTCLPGEAFGSLYPETFDAVLLDAPCSMQGLRSAESHSSRAITQNEIDALASRQTRLLESALRAAKPGGQVVYATCTLAPEEDELVLAALLERFPGIFQIEDVSARLPVPSPAIADIAGIKLPDQVRRALRLWPHRLGTAGFFTARLSKLESNPDIDSTSWRLPPAEMRQKPVGFKESQRLAALIRDQYGFNLAEVLAYHALAITSHHQQLYLQPTALAEKFSTLPILSSGMPLGKPIKEEFVISHEFASRFGDQFSAAVLILEDSDLIRWERGEDIRGYQDTDHEKGKIYAVRDRFGRNLGRGKLLTDRLKNMLPTRLF